MKADPAIGDDLEKPQYTDFFIKLPATIDYKQNTICLICAPAKRFKRKVTLSRLQKEKKNTTWVEMWIFFHLCRYFIEFNHQPVVLNHA